MAHTDTTTPKASSSSSSSFLTADSITVPGQRYALVSFVGPDDGLRQKNEKLGMKLRGCFANLDEAQAHAKELMEYDNQVDIYVLEMYQWALIPPDQISIENVEYRDKMLNDLMKGHIRNQKQARALFEQRKQAILAEGLDAHLLPHERITPPEGVQLPLPAVQYHQQTQTTATDEN